MIRFSPFLAVGFAFLTKEYVLAFQMLPSRLSRQYVVYSSTLQDFDSTAFASELALIETTAETATAEPSLICEGSDFSLPSELLQTTQITTIATDPTASSSFPKTPNDIWTGRLLVTMAAAMYGTNFPIVKLLDESLPSAVSAGLRFGLAAAVFSTIVLANEDKAMEDIVEKERFESTVRGMEVGVWYCIGYICQAMALQSVEAGKCAFFGALAVVIVPLLDAVCKRVSLAPASIMAIVFAMSGVGLIELGHGLSALQQGDILSLAMAGTFAFGYWRLEDSATRYPQMAPRITMGLLVAVAMGAITYGAVGNHWTAYDSFHVVEQLSDPIVLAELAWTGIGSTALALYLETMALKSITASELTMLMTTTSLWASGFAYFGLGEVLSPMAMAGGVLILAGCVVNAMGGHENNKCKNLGMR